MELPQHILEAYEVHEWKHASAILRTDFRNEWSDIIDVLAGIRVRRSHVLEKGGGRSKITQAIDGAFYARWWEQKKWETKIVDDTIPEGAAHGKGCCDRRVGAGMGSQIPTQAVQG